ncbi:MAG: hypothetical protein ABGY75_03960, partial [Gemmataceae bacterium]
RTPQGFPRVAAEHNLDKVELDTRPDGPRCHNELLWQVFQADPPRPVMLGPQSRLAAGGAVAANLTDFYALFAPIIGPEKQSLGLLEVFQESSFDPRVYPAFLQYAIQMAGYAGQYLASTRHDPAGRHHELMARLAELDKLRAERTPYPDPAEVTADWNWIHDQINARAVGNGLGQYAAVYQKQVVGLDTDSTRLELAMAHKYPDVHPDRFVIEYVN